MWYLIGSDCGGEHRTPFDFDAAVRRRLQREAEVVENDAERDADVNESHEDTGSEESR